MKILMIIIRSLMGAMFVFGGVVFFFHINMGKMELTGPAKTFNDGVTASGYLMQLIKGTELVCGILFLIGRFVPLAAVMIFPVIVNIFLYMAFLSPSALPLGIVLILFDLFLAYYYRKNYAGLLAAKA